MQPKKTHSPFNRFNSSHHTLSIKATTVNDYRGIIHHLSLLEYLNCHTRTTYGTQDFMDVRWCLLTINPENLNTGWEYWR